MTAPGSNSVYYLVEGQIGTVDGNPQSILFINSNGTTQYNNVNTYRSDVITYQTVEGAPAASPTPPPADLGWVPIGNVHITNGQTQVHSGDITMDSNTAFTALAACTSNCTFGGTTTMTNATVGGNVDVTGGLSRLSSIRARRRRRHLLDRIPKSLCLGTPPISGNSMAIGDANSGSNTALNLSLCGDISNVIPPGHRSKRLDDSSMDLGR